MPTHTHTHTQQRFVEVISNHLANSEERQILLEDDWWYNCALGHLKEVIRKVKKRKEKKRKNQTTKPSYHPSSLSLSLSYLLLRLSAFHTQYRSELDPLLRTIEQLFTAPNVDGHISSLFDQLLRLTPGQQQQQ